MAYFSNVSSIKAKAVEPLNIDDYAKAGAIITTLYGYYNNTNLAFDPAEEGPALTVIQKSLQ